MNRTSSWIVAIMIIGIAAAPALAVPMDFEIFRTSNPAGTLGVFTVDPALATPVGVSQVQMTALSFAANVSPFGTVSVTFDDFTVGIGTFDAIFFNGAISEISGAGSGSLDDLDFFMDFTPKGNPTIIDLDAVGTFALDAGNDEVIGMSAIGSIGIRPGLVPEPASMLLLATGFTALLIGRRHGRRVA